MTTSNRKKAYLVTFTQTIRFSSKIMASSPEHATAIIKNAHELLDPRNSGFLLENHGCTESDWAAEEIHSI